MFEPVTKPKTNIIYLRRHQATWNKIKKNPWNIYGTYCFLEVWEFRNSIVLTFFEKTGTEKWWSVQEFLYNLEYGTNTYLKTWIDFLEYLRPIIYNRRIHFLLMARDSWLMPTGSWFMAQKNLPPGPGGLRGKCFIGHDHEPWGMSLEPWAMSLEPLNKDNELFEIFYGY